MTLENMLNFMIITAIKTFIVEILSLECVLVKIEPLTSVSNYVYLFLYKMAKFYIDGISNIVKWKMGSHLRHTLYL